MIRSFFKSKKWSLWAYGGSLILILSLWIQVQLTVKINQWYGGFYDLLQNATKYTKNPEKGIGLFYDKLISIEWLFGTGEISFLVIALPYVVIAALTAWFTRLYSLRWREAITFDYIPRWENVDTKIEGASQRIQEDCAKFARLVETLGLDSIKALMTLIAFIPILWTLSKGVAIPFLENIEGSLVWTSLGVSIGGLVISWFVGIKLPGLEYNNQKVEASFRKNLVLAEDDSHWKNPTTLAELFTGIKFNYQRLYMHYGYFDIWKYFYDQIMIIVPYLIMGPGLFTAAITLGTMVQVSNAFQKVHGGFNLFLHRWTDVTELRSIWKRLNEFETSLGEIK